MAPRDGGEPADSMRRRVPGSRVKLWLLLDAHRWVLAGVVLAGLFVVFVTLGALDPTPIRETMASKDPIETTFQAMLTAIITGVTLVVTINQLVLSQELGAVGDQRERMQGAMAFRRDVEENLDRPVSPPEPSAFLRALIERTRSHAETLESTVADAQDDRFRRHVEGFAGDLIENADSVSDRLEGAQFGTFEVLRAALDYNYSFKIYEARRIKHEFADELDDRGREALDDVVDTLELFGPAREHFKTLYFQWELIDLSRAVIYAAIPALAVAGAMVLYVGDPGTIRGTTLGVDDLVWVASGATTVSLAPFAVLISYILRIATVAKRTLAIGPFVLRESGRSGQDWD